MIIQFNKDVAKLVKSWAISIGFKASKISVRTGSGKSGYICLNIRPEPYEKVTDPLKYERTIPEDICRRMLLVVYGNAKWVVDSKQCTGGNIMTHMATMVASQWMDFLNGEGFISN